MEVGQPPPDPQWSCRRKTRYANEDRAQGVATKTWHEQGIRLTTYLCVHCAGYHLTHQTRQQMKPGWREPKLSRRQEAAQRKADRRRFKR